MKLHWRKSEDDDDPMVRSFVRHHIPSPRKFVSLKKFVSLIDEDDEMYLFALKGNKGDRRRTTAAGRLAEPAWPVPTAVCQPARDVAA